MGDPFLIIRMLFTRYYYRPMQTPDILAAFGQNPNYYGAGKVGTTVVNPDVLPFTGTSYFESQPFPSDYAA